MSLADDRDIKRFLKVFPDEVQARALWLREWLWTKYPAANELVWDNYNALAIGFSITEKPGHNFAAVGVFHSSYNVNLGFVYGSLLADPKKLLVGEGAWYRYLLVPDVEAFPHKAAAALVAESYQNALAKVKTMKGVGTGQTIIRMTSEVKRPPAKRHSGPKLKSGTKRSPISKQQKKRA